MAETCAHCHRPPVGDPRQCEACGGTLCDQITCYVRGEGLAVFCPACFNAFDLLPAIGELEKALAATQDEIQGHKEDLIELRLEERQIERELYEARERLPRMADGRPVFGQVPMTVS